MKRILSIILAVMMAVTVVPTVFAEDYKEEVTDIELQDMVSLINKIGITDKEFNPDDSFITRGEFASLIVKSAGMADFIGDYKLNCFEDVDEKTLYSGEIALAKEMGLISGYSDNTFKPLNKITIKEASVSFIRLLGYDKKADAMGGYPAGYDRVIRDINLNKGIAGNLYLNRKDAVRLIYNALHTKVLIPKSYGGKNTAYEAKDGYTLLYQSFNIEYVEGVVRGIDITNLFGENDLPNYSVYINDKIYYTGQFNMDDMLSYYVRAYFKYEKGKDRVKIAFKDRKKNKEEIIDTKDITELTKEKLVSENDKDEKKSYKLTRNIPIIYNGTSTKAPLNIDLLKDNEGNIKDGSVKLVDNNNDKIFDALFIDAYLEIIVGRVDTYNNLVYDLNDKKIKYNLSNVSVDPFIIIYDENNNEIDISSVSENDSLIIYESKPDSYQKLIKVYKSSLKTEGVINEKFENDKGKFIRIGEETYKISNYASKNYGDFIVGRTAEFTINYKGEISKISYDIKPGDYGFALLCAAKKPKNFNESMTFKILTSENSFAILNPADKLKIDNVSLEMTGDTGMDDLLLRLKKATEQTNGIQKGNYYFTIIKYGINKEGKINYIDTLLDSDGEKMSGNNYSSTNELYMEEASGEYLASNDMLGGKVIVNDDAKVFMFPKSGDEADESYYDVRDKSFFINDTEYDNIKFFKDGEKGFGSGIFIKQYEKEKLSSDISKMTCSVITKVTDSIYKDNLTYKKLYLNTGGKEETLYIDPLLETADANKYTAKNLEPLDIIYYVTGDDKSEIKAYILCYKAKEDKIYMIKETTSNGMKKAHIISSTPKGIKLIFDDDFKISADPLKDSKYYIYNNVMDERYKIVVIDKDKKKVRIGSYNDLIGYDEDSINYSKVLIRHQHTDILREMFLYQ